MLNSISTTSSISSYMPLGFDSAIPKVTTPWYATVANQRLPLSNELRVETGLDKPIPEICAIINEIDFWADLTSIGLKYDMLEPAIALSLINATTGTKQQVTSAQQVADSMLKSYTTTVTAHEEAVLGYLQQHGINQPFFNEIVQNSADGKFTWSPELTICDTSQSMFSFGESCQFDKLAVRLEFTHGLSALYCEIGRDMDNDLGQLIYLTIEMLANVGHKTNTLDAIAYYPSYESNLSALEALKLTKAQTEQLAMSEQEDDITAALAVLNINLDNFNEEELEYPEEFFSSARHAHAINTAPWYVNNKYFNLRVEEIMWLLSDRLSAIKLSSLDDKNRARHGYLTTILNVISHFYQHDTQPWEDASDLPMSSCMCISFGTELEDEHLNYEHENIMNIGEGSAIALDLSKGDCGTATIKNMILSEFCLFALSAICE